MIDQTLVLGGPGCGKTTALIQIVEEHLSRGVPPERVAYLAFTRKAATEARDRTMAKFNLTKEDIPFFRTIHSFAFRALGLGSEAMMGPRLFRQFADHAGLTLKALTDDDPYGTATDDDRALAALNLSRITLRDAEDVCLEMKISQERFNYVSKELLNFKNQRVVIDYTDLLERYLALGELPSIDVLIVDEAQDLSRLQWEVVFMLARTAKHVYIGGDDDQAIYEWAGADVQTFLKLSGTRRVLPKSYRLKSRIFDVAQRIISTVSDRFSKDWTPREHGGNIDQAPNIGALDVHEGSWFVLARNKYALSDSTQILRQRGLPYIMGGESVYDTLDARAIKTFRRLMTGEALANEDAAFLVSRMRNKFVPKTSLAADKTYTLPELAELCRLPMNCQWADVLDMKARDAEYYGLLEARGDDMTGTPQITLSTIHGVKGGEADNVAIIPDLSRATYASVSAQKDSEARAFFVAVSRAKENLFFIHPKTSRYWNAAHYL